MQAQAARLTGGQVTALDIDLDGPALPEHPMLRRINGSLGDPAARTPWVVMHNVLGGDEPDLTGALLHCFARDRRLRAELYGKPVTPRRKVGHVTAYGTDLDEVRSRASHAARYLMGEPHD